MRFVEEKAEADRAEAEAAAAALQAQLEGVQVGMVGIAGTACVLLPASI